MVFYDEMEILVPRINRRPPPKLACSLNDFKSQNNQIDGVNLVQLSEAESDAESSFGPSNGARSNRNPLLERNRTGPDMFMGVVSVTSHHQIQLNLSPLSETDLKLLFPQ